MKHSFPNRRFLAQSLAAATLAVVLAPRPSPAVSSHDFPEQCLEYWRSFSDPLDIVLCDVPRDCRCYVARRLFAYEEEINGGIPVAASIPHKLAKILDSDDPDFTTHSGFWVHTCSATETGYDLRVSFSITSFVPLVVTPEHCGIHLVVEEKNGAGRWAEVDRVWPESCSVGCPATNRRAWVGWYLTRVVDRAERTRTIRYRLDVAGDHIPLYSEEYELRTDYEFMTELLANRAAHCDRPPTPQPYQPPRPPRPPRPPPPDVCTYAE